MTELARPRGFGSPAVQPVWIGVGVPPDFFWVGSFWVKGFVGEARSALETQRHQEMLVAEGVKESDLADSLREQLHRDRIGLKALHYLTKYVKSLENDSISMKLFSQAICEVALFDAFRYQHLLMPLRF